MVLLVILPSVTVLIYIIVTYFTSKVKKRKQLSVSHDDHFTGSETLMSELQRLRNENDRLYKEKEDLEKQLNYYRRKESASYDAKKQFADGDNDPTELITQYQRFFKDVPLNLHDVLHNVMSKHEVYEMSSAIMQESYHQCRTSVIDMMKHYLIDLLSLSDTESRTGKVEDFGENGIDKQRAYALLLNSCGIKNTLPPPAVTNQVNDVICQSYPQIPTAQQHLVFVDIANAISLTWKMVTLNAPFIVCQPKKYLSEWQEKHAFAFTASQGPYILTYHRPLVLNIAKRQTVVAGKVGSRDPDEGEEYTNVATIDDMTYSLTSAGSARAMIPVPPNQFRDTSTEPRTPSSITSATTDTSAPPKQRIIKAEINSYSYSDTENRVQRSDSEVCGINYDSM